VTLTNNMPAHKFFPRPLILPHFTHEMEAWGNGTPEDPLGGCTTFISMMGQRFLDLHWDGTAGKRRNSRVT
jgi:hypothetical protein